MKYAMMREAREHSQCEEQSFVRRSGETHGADKAIPTVDGDWRMAWPSMLTDVEQDE